MSNKRKTPENPDIMAPLVGQCPQERVEPTGAPVDVGALSGDELARLANMLHQESKKPNKLPKLPELEESMLYSIRQHLRRCQLILEEHSAWYPARYHVRSAIVETLRRSREAHMMASSLLEFPWQVLETTLIRAFGDGVKLRVEYTRSLSDLTFTYSKAHAFITQARNLYTLHEQLQYPQVDFIKSIIAKIPRAAVSQAINNLKRTTESWLDLPVDRILDALADAITTETEVYEFTNRNTVLKPLNRPTLNVASPETSSQPRFSDFAHARYVMVPDPSLVSDIGTDADARIVKRGFTGKHYMICGYNDPAMYSTFLQTLDARGLRHRVFEDRTKRHIPKNVQKGH